MRRLLLRGAFSISNNFTNGTANIQYDWMRRIEQDQYMEYDEQKLH